MFESLFVAQVALINALVVTQAREYPSPLRSWQNGFFAGNPQYSPVGAFQNYSMIFRNNDGVTDPDSFLMIETVGDFPSTVMSKSYQQWTIYGTQLTYCGLLTFDEGKSYKAASPQFVYQPQLSSESEVYFCADPRAGGCGTFWWLWKYDSENKQLMSNVTVGGIPHELTFLDFYPAVNADEVQVEQQFRDACSYLLGQQNPYNYNWMTLNFTASASDCTMMDAHSRQRLKDNIPNYHRHYEHRVNYHQ